MAKLPPIRRFTKEDFKSQVSWIETLLYPLNLFIQGVTSALRNQLTIKENLLAQINTMLITTQSSVTAPASFPEQYGVIPAGTYSVSLPSATLLTSPVSYSCSFSVTPQAVVVGKLVEYVGNPRITYYGVTVDWSYNSGVITLNAVSGLQPNTSYELTVITYYG